MGSDQNQKFDKEKDPTDGDPTQVFKLLVKERTVTVTEPKNPNDPVDPDKPEGPKWPATGLAKSDLEKEVTRTITYVKKETADGPEIADAKPTKKQTAHFKRSATYNAVTGTITYGNWESADKELAKVDTPILIGYVADKASVDKVETNENSTGLDQKVVYTKLGSWVPKVPGVETPIPLPYPNHPTDPTKPGDPTNPNTPNVPVIPYVPGYTPKIGETPLQPKVPNDPTQGYIPPAVPTDPGEDTPITYEKVPDKPTPVDPNRPTPENPNILDPVKPGMLTPGSPTIPNAVPGNVTEKQQVKRLANTGATETNTGVAGLGLAMFGMALAAIKRRKDK